jgi:hypothetical protein
MAMSWQSAAKINAFHPLVSFCERKWLRSCSGKAAEAAEAITKAPRYSKSMTTDYDFDLAGGNWTRSDELRTMTQTQTIFASTLKGTHQLTRHFTIDWTGLFADANEKDPRPRLYHHQELGG